MDLIPLEQLAKVLELGFFPQWHQALRSWLGNRGCNFSEVLQWRLGLTPPYMYIHSTYKYMFVIFLYIHTWYIYKAQ